MVVVIYDEERVEGIWGSGLGVANKIADKIVKGLGLLKKLKLEK
jgi:hypothetical protein